MLNFLLPDVFSSADQFDEWFNPNAEEREREDVLSQAHACYCAVYVASACCCAVYVARRGAREGGCALAGTRLLL